MLKRAKPLWARPSEIGIAIGIAIASICFAPTSTRAQTPAQAQVAAQVAARTPPQTSLIDPERLTVGAADQFLAVLDPAGERLVWVSNENATTELFGAEMSVRAPQRLFDDAADATAPRISPDGKRLLYLSFRSAATGELCVREWEAQGLGLSDRRCLSLAGRTVMQALWEPGGHSALVVSRDGLRGEIDLRRFNTDAAADAPGQLLLQRDLSSPALSPDGKWLLYVPVARLGPVSTPTPPPGAPPAASPDVPGAATATSRVSKSLGLISLGDLAAEPKSIAFPLPGLPGFPAFSPDGKFVYFVQYLNDTNLDGVVDANDRAVLFRAPFESAKEDPIDVAKVQQLTSADWDCQYPFPAEEHLLATCLNAGSLDVYALPLEGVIPATWAREQLMQELATNRSPWQRLLVFTRLLELDTNDAERGHHLKRIVEMHLSMHEYQSAGFYAGQLEKLAAGKDGDEWHEEAGIGLVLRELAHHRRALSSVSEGEATHAVTDAMRERVQTLEPMMSSPLPAVALLSALVVSEIEDALGDEAQALLLLARVRAHIDAHSRTSVLHLFGQRTHELYEPLNDRGAVLSVDLLLSQHKDIEPDEQIDYAEDYVHDLLRGLSHADADAQLAEVAKKLPPESNAAFAVELERALRPLTTQNQPEIEQRIFALFDRNTTYERRRCIVHETVARAKATSSEVLWYDVAEKWTEAVGKTNPDRKRTEAIYKKVAMERAYVEWSRGDLASARSHFDAVTRRTSSLEAISDDIDTSLQSGATPEEIERDVSARYAAEPAAPELLFSLSYLESRKLAGEASADAVAHDADEAKGRLRTALHAMPNDIPIHYLWAYLRHQEYLRTGDKATAMRANAHYQIVVDLARDEPRYRAAALSGLGFLHGRLGNHSMAAGFLEERATLPPRNPLTALAVCMQLARDLLHSDHEKEAAAESDKCVAMVDAAPTLSRFLPFALDRSALLHLDAGEATEALARYDRLEPLTKDQDSAGEKEGSELFARRNRFVVFLGRASAQLALNHASDALADLDQADALFHLPKAIPKMQSIYARKNSSSAFTQESIDEDYEVLLSGLRARALSALGKRDEAKAPTERRLVLLQKRAKRDGDKPAGADDQRFIALAEANLAAGAYQAGDFSGALAHVEAGLLAADELERISATPIQHVTVALLGEYAQLHFGAHLPLARLKLDLTARLRRAFAELADHPQARFQDASEQFALDLDRLMLEGVDVALR